jgi:simple sugar transport system ATP-binding protein
MRNKGCAILLVSADLDEILNISDRIAFIYEGKIVTVRDSNVLKREEIGLLMSGIENEGNTTTREG